MKSRIKLDMTDVRLLDADGNQIYLQSPSIQLEMSATEVDTTPLRLAADVPTLVERERSDLFDRLLGAMDQYLVEHALLKMIER